MLETMEWNSCNKNAILYEHRQNGRYNFDGNAINTPLWWRLIHSIGHISSSSWRIGCLAKCVVGSWNSLSLKLHFPKNFIVVFQPNYSVWLHIDQFPLGYKIRITATKNSLDYTPAEEGELIDRSSRCIWIGSRLGHRWGVSLFLLSCDHKNLIR